MNSKTAPGATVADWAHFDLVLSLTEDLLPCVSNPQAKIANGSKLQEVGKVPSLYTKDLKVVGMPGWTQHITMSEDIDRWSKQQDYGICLQTRVVRAIDCDITDPHQADAIAYKVLQVIGVDLPRRHRANSSKFLLVFRYADPLAKRILRTEHGAIELLATGQQFVAVGTHPSGVRYEWENGLPDTIPELTLEQIERLWSELHISFAVAPSLESKISSKAQQLETAIAGDPIAVYLAEHGWVKHRERDGRLHIKCPFEDEHTTFTSDSATTYFPAHTGGYAQGHFRCLHAHCAHRTDYEFTQAIGLIINEFDEIEIPGVEADPEPVVEVKRFKVQQAAEFASGKPPRWLIKEVLPAATLGVVFGASGSGKSFFVLDLLGAVARGVSWRDHRTFPGTCVYIAAEGAGGFRSRLRAYAQHHGIELDSLDIGIIGDAPNFLMPMDVKDVLTAVQAFGNVNLIVVDTFAQVMPGGNENNGEDVGKAIAHCKTLHRHTGAMVLLVHHSGKDASRGARGWSGLRAAADVEIEIARDNTDRAATITKMKDWQDGAVYGFRLNSVVLGEDDDGDPITSCVVVHDPAPGRTTNYRGIKGEVPRLLWQTINNLASLGTSGDVPMEHAFNITLSHIPHDDINKRDRRRATVSRALDNLVKQGFVCIKKGFIIVNTKEDLV